jgi:hypothetical protein
MRTMGCGGGGWAPSVQCSTPFDVSIQCSCPRVKLGVFVHQRYRATPVVVSWRVSVVQASPCSHSVGSPITSTSCRASSANPNWNRGGWPAGHHGARVAAFGCHSGPAPRLIAVTPSRALTRRPRTRLSRVRECVFLTLRRLVVCCKQAFSARMIIYIDSASARNALLRA